MLRRCRIMTKIQIITAEMVGTDLTMKLKSGDKTVEGFTPSPMFTGRTQEDCDRKWEEWLLDRAKDLIYRLKMMNNPSDCKQELLWILLNKGYDVEIASDG